MSRSLEWHIVTPHEGGVADYVRRLSGRLAAAGDEVHIWAPSRAMTDLTGARVRVRGTLGGFAPSDLWRTDRALRQYPAPRRLFVQWVPHGYGWRSVNVQFCLWLLKRRLIDHDRVELMVHEPFLAFREGGWRQDAVAVVHRLMMLPLLAAASRVWISIPAWEAMLRPYSLGRRIDFAWLPVPSNVDVRDDPEGIEGIRRKLAGSGGQLIGHFGTYAKPVTGLLRRVIPELLTGVPSRAMLLLGRGGQDFRAKLAAEYPALAGRIHAPGELPEEQLSLHLSACDLMVQPYPDGISTRRTSAMAGLAHGRPVVTTLGYLTEASWEEQGAVALVRGSAPEAIVAAAERLLNDPTARAQLGVRAAAVYGANFDLGHVVDRLRGQTDTVREEVLQ